jgi:hypothetical protein
MNSEQFYDLGAVPIPATCYLIPILFFDLCSLVFFLLVIPAKAGTQVIELQA